MLGSQRGEGYAIHWKRDKSSEIKDYLLTFGISPTGEEAAARVERALLHGTVNPMRSPEEFRRQARGGVFYPVAVHLGVPVP